MVRLHERARTFMERQGKRYTKRVNRDIEGRVFAKGVDNLNLRINSFQEEESDTNWGDQEDSQKDLAGTIRGSLQGPLFRGKLKKLEVEVQRNFREQGVSKVRSTLFVLS
ncbi:hypothetical protein CR513_03738, partial [Mucuna pruriens]